MTKKVIIIVVLVFGVLAGLVYLGLFIIGRILYPYGHELEVVINNNTEIELTEFYLTYRGLEEDISIDDISKGDSITLRIDAKDNVDESSLDLYYFDNNSARQEVVVIGYFEHSGGGQKSIVNINSIDENGVYEIEIEGIRP